MTLALTAEALARTTEKSKPGFRIMLTSKWAKQYTVISRNLQCETDCLRTTTPCSRKTGTALAVPTLHSWLYKPTDSLSLSF